MIYKDVLHIRQENGPRKIPESVPVVGAYLFHRYPDHNQTTIYRMTEIPDNLYQQAQCLSKNKDELIAFIEEMIFHRL